MVKKKINPQVTKLNAEIKNLKAKLEDINAVFDEVEESNHQLRRALQEVMDRNMILPSDLGAALSDARDERLRRKSEEEQYDDTEW